MAVIFDKNGLATQAGDIRCFYYDAVTGEYNGWSDEHIYVGVSMPGNSTSVNPGDEQAGFVAVFNGTVWEQQPDHRGETVWSTADGTASIVGYIGEIKTGFTELPPSTPYDVWNGASWVTDTDLQHATDVANAEKQKTQLRALADNEITWRQDAVDEGIAKAEESSALAEWKKYRVLLMRVDTSKAPDIVWPISPAPQK
ncbi:tail fiber assembly protein [Kluyvera cryocrescens]|uniref:tail fiber assembly protein n=1 Tax=Kluyvera cryocrescens TaxID=580 RepID=UPI000774C15D|nr:tail fiber assembly protein [Kluyvera cryocrescens]